MEVKAVRVHVLRLLFSFGARAGAQRGSVAPGGLGYLDFDIPGWKMVIDSKNSCSSTEIKLVSCLSFKVSFK